MESCFQSTEVTRNLDRVVRVLLIHNRVWYCIVSGLGLNTVTSDVDTTRLSRVGID